MSCCVGSESLVEDWTRDLDIPQSFDKNTHLCIEETIWEVKEGAFDWKPICEKHKIVFESHQDECPEVRFRPLFYVIHEEILELS